MIEMNTLHDIDTSLLTFSTRSDLFDNGNHCEDGSELTGSHHYVVATTPNGRQFFRCVGTSSWMYDVDEEDGCPQYYQSRDPAELNRSASVLAERLEAIKAPVLNASLWFEGEAAYGSTASLQQEVFSPRAFG